MKVLRARLVRRMGEDRGQTSVEFLGMLPIILITLVALWQCALVGYTYTMAGNAADEAARAGAVADERGLAAACERGAKEDLGDGWRTTGIACRSAPGLVKAEVKLAVPVLFPGSLDFDLDVTGDAAAAKEG